MIRMEKKMSVKKRANGEGTVYFVEKEQLWLAEISWIDSAGNKQRKRWRAKKQTEVKAKLTEFKKQLLLNGADFKPEERKFRDFADEWVNVILKPKIKPLSYQRKVSTLENQVYKHLGNTPISKITHAQIQKMINDLTDSGLSYSTVKKAYEAVLGCMRKLHRTGWKAIMKIGGCGILLALHWVAFFASIQASNVSIGVACVATSCFFTTLFDPMVNRRRVQWKNILLSFIAIAGILFIFSIDVRFRLGIALGLLCAALYSLFSIFNINVANETKEDSATMLMYELAGGVLFLTLCIPVFRAIYPAEAVVPVGNDLLSLLLLGSVFTVIPFLFQLQALRKLSAFTVNMAYNLEPLYSIAIAAILFGELQEVGFSFWVGIFLIVLSVVLQTYSVIFRERKKAS